ncbi:MAG: FAD-binding protein, partial [Actinomycetota bacterium]
MSGPVSYEARRARLIRDLEACPADTPIRLRKRTSNLFRTRRGDAWLIDVDGFDGVLSVDPSARTADVLGMTTYEHLVDATLPYGLMPLVVPQLKTITIGGAVAGLGIESSSFRNGMPHESVLEMEILTGDGAAVRATPDGDHPDLYAGFPNSYGTLGYALRLTIALEQVKPYVRLRHVRHTDATAFFNEVSRVCSSEQVDFVDGTIFGERELVLTLGTFVDDAPATSDYTGMEIYYRSLQRKTEDHLTARDYLWRWDTDWFWCSKAFGVQNPSIRRLIPRRYLRSDTYGRLLALDRRRRLSARLDRIRGRSSREAVVQDVEIPVDRAAEFLEFFHRRVGITPVWMCPLRQRDPHAIWPLYALDPRRLYINFGFWSSVALRPGEPDGTYNRLIEEKV